MWRRVLTQAAQSGDQSSSCSMPSMVCHMHNDQPITDNKDLNVDVMQTL